MDFLEFGQIFQAMSSRGLTGGEASVFVFCLQGEVDSFR